MPIQIAIITAIAHNRGGDIACAKKLIEWLKIAHPALQIHWILQFDASSAPRIPGLKTYAQTENIHLFAHPAQFIVKQNQWDEKTEALISSPEKLKSLAAADQEDFLEGYSLLPTDSKPRNSITQKIHDILSATKTIAIFSVPNPHRIPTESMTYLSSLTKPFFPIFEYNLHPCYGDISSRSTLLYKLAQSNKHIIPIETGIGSGPFNLRTALKEKKGVFLSSAQKNQYLITDLAPEDAYLTQFLGNENAENFLAYFFLENNYQQRQIEGRSTPNQRDGGKPSVITVESYIKLLAKLIKSSPKKEINIILPITFQKAWEEIQDIFLQNTKKENIAINSFNQGTLEEKLKKTDKKESKTINLINTGALKPTSFQTCLALTNPLCCVSGDQSFIEALEHGKLIAYQLLRWKTELLFNFVAFVQAKMPNSHLSNFYSFLLNHDDQQKAIDDLAKYYRDHTEDLKKEAQTFARDHLSTQNLMTSFDKLISPTLTSLISTLKPTHPIPEPTIPEPIIPEPIIPDSSIKKVAPPFKRVPMLLKICITILGNIIALIAAGISYGIQIYLARKRARAELERLDTTTTKSENSQKNHADIIFDQQSHGGFIGFMNFMTSCGQEDRPQYKARYATAKSRL